MCRDEYAQQNLGAEHIHPAIVRRLLEQKPEEAVRKLISEPESFRYPDLKKPYYIVREYRAGVFPDKEAHPFAIAAESDSFIESMNILYAPETPKISRDQVKM